MLKHLYLDNHGAQLVSVGLGKKGLLVLDSPEALALSKLETRKHLLWQTMKTQMKCSRVQYFFSVRNGLAEYNLHRKIYYMYSTSTVDVLKF